MLSKHQSHHDCQDNKKTLWYVARATKALAHPVYPLDIDSAIQTTCILMPSLSGMPEFKLNSLLNRCVLIPSSFRYTYGLISPRTAQI